MLPPSLNLTSERLERHGLFLIEDGQNIFLWVGQEAVPQLVMDVFDLPNYQELKGGKVSQSRRDLIANIQLTMLFVRIVHPARTREPLLSACQRDHRQDARDATKSLLAASLRCQGGCRAGSPELGLESVDRGQGRQDGELFAVFGSHQGQGGSRSRKTLVDMGNLAADIRQSTLLSIRSTDPRSRHN